MVTLAILDVPGDDLAVTVSGPAAPDPSAAGDRPGWQICQALTCRLQYMRSCWRRSGHLSVFEAMSA
ncbi:MAG: DUF4147 domain-containing protein [Alphaproteobacteria bacterium]|nr:DUF4147 domain-containing protein [Alphaproteobacteria bacterium]